MKMERRHTLLKEVIFWGIIGITTAIGLYLIILAAYSYKPLVVESVVPDEQVVCRGEELCFIFRGEKFYDVPAYVTVELVNGERYVVMNYASNTPKGSIFRKRCFFVPYHVKPAKYQIVWTGSYQMNAFNIVHVRANSDWVEVTTSGRNKNE